MRTIPVAAALLLSVPSLVPVSAQDGGARSAGGGNCADNVYNCWDTPNPLPPVNTVWLEEMTWMDVRDALRTGKTTAIVSTGGVEPNGPWLASGKHQYVLRATCEATARELGNAICTPIIEFVPEGSIDPPSGHMLSPGTISVREETFQAMLTDVAGSLRAHGFRAIVFIGDSGGNQRGQRAVAERLTEQWGGNPVVAHVQEYYDYASVMRYMEGLGLRPGESDGLHDDPTIALNMFHTDPNSIRYDERVAAGLASIDGVSLADRVRNLEWARQIVDFRARQTAAAIRRAIGYGGTVPAPPRPQAAAAPSGGGGPQPASARPAPDPRTMGGGDCRRNAYNCSDTPNPLPEASTVWLEEMTWMDVRDALAAGRTTVIVSTGGIEPNGPWLATGKHNYALRANCTRLAAALGNALCAPIMELVPEGSIDPPSGHMTSPGTLSLRQETFEAVLTDVARSLKMHGFTEIVMIGDSGGNQSGMADVAEALTAEWDGAAKVIHVREYYDAFFDGIEVLRDLGAVSDDATIDGLHDQPEITLNMMLADPASVRWAERVRSGQATIDGMSIADLGQALTWAEAIVDERIRRTVETIEELRR